MTVRGHSPISDKEEWEHSWTEEVSGDVELVAKRYPALGPTSLISKLTQICGEQMGDRSGAIPSCRTAAMTCQECNHESLPVCLEDLLMPVLATDRLSGKGTAGDKLGGVGLEEY